MYACVWVWVGCGCEVGLRNGSSPIFVESCGVTSTGLWLDLDSSVVSQSTPSARTV